jgi:hypothetical protein
VSSAEQPAQPDTPNEPDHTASASGESVVGETTALVHRSPRYFNFMLLGAIIGALAAFVLTVAFPDNPDFGKTQVFGFLLLAGVTVGVALGSFVALILDRLGRSRTVVVDKIVEKVVPADPAPDADSSSRSSNENPE